MRSQFGPRQCTLSRLTNSREHHVLLWGAANIKASIPEFGCESHSYSMQRLTSPSADLHTLAQKNNDGYKQLSRRRLGLSLVFLPLFSILNTLALWIVFFPFFFLYFICLSVIPVFTSALWLELKPSSLLQYIAFHTTTKWLLY